MNTTPERIGRVATLGLAVAGALFIAVQIKHPPLDLELVGTTEFTLRQTAKTAMTVLALAGITGVYLHQGRRLGVLGLAGWLIFSLGYLAMFAVEAIATFVFPTLENTSPEFVQDVLTAAVGGKPEGDIGGMQILLNLSGIGYLLGGLVFGVALLRAGVVPRWTAALLAVATTSTAALAFLPEAFNRPIAIPTGVALIAVGWSSWKAQRPMRTVETSRVAEPVAR